MEGSTAASGAPIASASTGAMINPASAARKRAQNTLQMQLVIVSFMNQTADVIDNWCTPTNHKLSVGLDKCLLSVIANLETEVKSEESPIYKSPVPSKDVSRPSPSIYVSPSALVSGSLQAVKGWIRDWITKHRIAQEAQKTTGSGDNGGPAPTREDIAIAEEMNNLVAEIDRIDKARRTSDKEATDKEKLGEDIRTESLRGLEVHLRKGKGKKRKNNNDDAGDDDEADEASSSRLGNVPHVTPSKGTRLTRCGGTPDSSGGSDEGQSLESEMADFASAKQAAVKGKETTADAELLKAKAALLDAQTRADEAKSRAEMQAKEIESRAKSEDATRTMMLKMAEVLGKIAEKL